eukprot:1630804-Prymnesium_polylepis.1
MAPRLATRHGDRAAGERVARARLRGPHVGTTQQAADEPVAAPAAMAVDADTDAELHAAGEVAVSVETMCCIRCEAAAGGI